MKLLESVYNIVIEAYSEKMYQTLLDKFISDGAQKEDAILYIDRFSDIKNNLPTDKRDITKYSWGDLKDIISANPIKRKKVGKVSDLNDENLIYNENGLKIYRGKSQEDCIRYGEGYSFCISSRGTKSFYNDYRVRKNGTPYFIFDSKKSKEGTHKDYVDPQHLIVLFVYQDKMSSYNNGKTYSISDANNRGEIPFKDWDELESKFPRLSGLSHLFRPTELIPKENDLFNLMNDLNSKLSDLKFENRTRLISLPYKNVNSVYGLIGKDERIEDMKTYVNNSGGPYYEIVYNLGDSGNQIVDKALTNKHAHEIIHSEIKRNQEQGNDLLTNPKIYRIIEKNDNPGEWYVNYIKSLLDIYQEYKHGVVKIQLKYK